MSVTILSPDAAIRLATLRIQGPLSDEEQNEIIHLEVQLAEQLKIDPTYRLPNVLSPSISNDGTEENDSSRAKSKSNEDNDDSDSYDHFENTSASAANPSSVTSSTSSSNNHNQACNQNQQQSSSGSYFGSVGNFVSSILPSKQSIDQAAKAGWFWTSIAVGTAAPGFISKTIGLTEGFDYWNWILPPQFTKNNSINNNNSNVEHGGTGTSPKSSLSASSTTTPPHPPIGGLILGALPVLTAAMGSGDHLKVLHKEVRQLGTEMGMVVSALQENEVKGFGVEVIKFASHDDWRAEFGKDELIARLLQVEDCTPDGFDFETLESVLKEMHETMHLRGKCVYVHCKAGKGRSWVIVICYLIAYRNMTIDAAATLVKARRHQVNPSRTQVGFVEEFYKRTMKAKSEAALRN